MHDYGSWIQLFAGLGTATGGAAFLKGYKKRIFNYCRKIAKSIDN